MSVDPHPTGPVIQLAPGVEAEGLPEMLATLLRQNLEQRPERIKDFRALHIAVGLRVVDLDMEITLRFQEGELTIHKGLVKDPGLVITADSEIIFDLNLIRIRFGLPWYFDAQGRKILKALLSGRLKIQGMFAHSISLTRLTKVMSVN